MHEIYMICRIILLQVNTPRDIEEYFVIIKRDKFDYFSEKPTLLVQIT